VARASDADLDGIEDVLAALRALPGVTEKKRGVFYRGRDAFVHFHAEDGAIYADAKITPGKGFERFSLDRATARDAFVTACTRAKD
jgi:hypothetical protein